MDYETLAITKTPKIATITINRPERKNSINSVLLDEMNRAFDMLENDPEVRIIALQGKGGYFCTGMDFNEISQIDTTDRDGVKRFASAYLDILKRFTRSSKVIVSIIDGAVNAGGIGFAAASDVVFSTGRATFSLSEAMFGLLPANVLPFLIRRIGFQKSYFLTLTTRQIDADYARSINLVDEITENPADSLRRLMLRIIRIKGDTIVNIKDYFTKMWIITREMEEIAVEQITDLICDKNNMEGIINFVAHQTPPWNN